MEKQKYSYMFFFYIFVIMIDQVSNFRLAILLFLFNWYTMIKLIVCYFVWIKWLYTEALPNNPKVEVNIEGKFQFRPPLKCRDKKSVLRLLKQHDLKGLGGILRDDVVESVPHAEKVLKVGFLTILLIINSVELLNWHVFSSCTRSYRLLNQK